jgi:hypothetical protein
VRRTTSTISGWLWPMMALICPEQKSRMRRPCASHMKLPCARSAMMGTKSPP